MNNLNLIYDNITSYVTILEVKQRESINNKISQMRKKLESPNISKAELRFLPERIEREENSIERDIFLEIRFKI